MRATSVSALLLIFGMSMSQGVFAQEQEQYPTTACLATLPVNKFRPLNEKVALISVEDQTFAMLTNTEKPNDREKFLISQWMEYRNTCFKYGADYRGKLPTALRLFAESMQNSTQLLATDLYAGKITYGDFAKERARKYEELQKDLNAQMSAPKNNPKGKK